jgi:TonB family protein
LLRLHQLRRDKRLLVSAPRRRWVAPALALLLAATAAWAAKPELRVFFAPQFKDVPYQKAAVDKVHKAWRPPIDIPKEGSKAVVIVTIMRDGTVSDTKLHYKSGSDKWDAAALAAVKAAGPFAPLPKSYYPNTVEAHFHFGVAAK